MVLQIQPEHLQAIRAHAESTYPEECCGLLLGKFARERKKLCEVRPTENAWREQTARELGEDTTGGDTTGEDTTGNLPSSALTKERRYIIEPAEMLQVLKEARSRDLSVIGVYHSHPDHPAIPSECDRALAWPEYSYLIVSVPQGKAAEILAWNLDEESQFQPEKIILADTLPQ